MGYAGKLDLKYKAIELRKRGLSYREIRISVPVSKDTISRWCKDIVLTERQKIKLLSMKMYGQKKGSLIAAENKRVNRIKRTDEIIQDAKKEIGILSQRDEFLVGIAIYAGEGDKYDGKGGFSNANPYMIKFMATWLQQYCNLPLSRIRGALWLRENLDETKAKVFWSSLTGIPLSQFQKTHIVKIDPIKKAYRKNIHEYGIFSIRFSDSAVHRRLMGWIYAVLDGKMAER